jgi:Tol biopolymer transport system component
MDGKTGPKTVVFISNFEDTVYNLWQLTLSDRSLKKLTSYTDWNVGSPSFSPDGSRVLISLYRANVSQIYSLKADGSDPVQITTAGTGNLCPRYAQGGKKIVYCALEDSGNVGLNVLQMNADGKDSKALTHEGGSSPSWSPGQVQPLAPFPLKTK